MDSVLSGVIGLVVGGFFTMFGNWLANHFALKREENLWQRQEETKQRDHERELMGKEKEQQLKKEENLREVYAKCLQHLSEVSDWLDMYSAEDQSFLSMRSDAVKWVNLLASEFNDPDPHLDEFIRNFSYYPRKREFALELREEIIKMYRE